MTIPQGKLNQGDVLLISWGRGESFLSDLFLLDHSGLNQLTNNTGYWYFSGQWFPDAKQILVHKNYAQQSEVYVIGTDGKQIRAFDGLLDRVAFDLSPDGQFLSYYYRDVNKGEVSVTFRVHRLSDDSLTIINHSLLDYIWAADSQSIIGLESDDNGDFLIQQFAPDGTLTKSTKLAFLSDYAYISISPDAKKIAFDKDSGDPEDMPDLCIADIDGSNIVTIGKHNVHEAAPVWSPDSKKLAFVGIRDENELYHLFVVDADGQNLRDLMPLDEGDDSGEVYPGSPAWSPDSQQIAIKSHIVIVEDEEWETYGDAIFVMNADGRNLRRISEPDGIIFKIDWKPS